jgi:hypothetical protein
MMRSDRRSNKVMVLEIVEEELAAAQKKKVLKGYHPTAEEKNEKRVPPPVSSDTEVTCLFIRWSRCPEIAIRKFPEYDYHD